MTASAVGAPLGTPTALVTWCRSGYVDPAALDAIVETYESKVGPRNRAKVVGRAWVDAEYREWLPWL